MMVVDARKTAMHAVVAAQQPGRRKERERKKKEERGEWGEGGRRAFRKHGIQEPGWKKW